jgi:hypothetical protein
MKLYIRNAQIWHETNTSCVVAPDNGVLSIELAALSRLTPRILRSCLDFWKRCPPLLYILAELSGMVLHSLFHTGQLYDVGGSGRAANALMKLMFPLG